jgi:hypothetical protein
MFWHAYIVYCLNQANHLIFVGEYVYLLSNFQKHNMLSLTIMIILYNRTLAAVFLQSAWNFVPFDQYVPSLPTPSLITTINSTLFLWIQLLLIYSINEIMWFLSFYASFIWLYMMFSKFIHIATNDRIPLFLKADSIPLHIQICHIIFCIHPLMDT